MTNALPSQVVELRQYTLRPGQRETLVELFERSLVEPQEAAGAQVIGQFRDLDRPDRFVWLRGFPDMVGRERALSAFYGGPVWGRHRNAANATMLDSDDVLLLRPVDVGPAFPPAGDRRPAGDASSPPTSVVTATLYPLDGPAGEDLLRQFTAVLEPLLCAAGSPRLALLETEDATNTFPRLPVREGEHHLVRFAGFPGEQAAADVEARLRSSPAWAGAWASLGERLVAPPEVLRLQPTPRSLLR